MSDLTRTSINLTPRASRALEQVTDLTGDSKTDAINRAVSVYAYIEQALHDGGKVFVQEPGDAAPQPIKIL